MSEYDYQETVNAVDIDDLDDHTPEQIAEVLFSQGPKEPFSFQILADADKSDPTCLFEILLIILVRGMEVLSGDLSQADLNNMTAEHISNLDPWFKSLGFTVKVDGLIKEDIEEYEEYYCRILIKDKVNTFLFEQRGFPNNYHFLLNGQYLKENQNKKNLNELYTIFNNNSHIFKIGFNFYKPPANTVTTKLL